MSWKARTPPTPQEFNYFPKPYLFGPAVTNKSFVSSASSKTLKATVSKLNDNNPAPSPAKSSTSTTMTGLPWAVRQKLEGKLKPESPRRTAPARLGNYTFTYGLSKEDEDQIRSEVPARLGVSVVSFKLIPRAEPQVAQHLGVVSRSLSTNNKARSAASERLKSIKQSLSKPEQSPNKSKSYFQNWHKSKSSGLLDGQDDYEDAGTIVASTQNTLQEIGFHDGLSTYLDALNSYGVEKMDDSEDDVLPIIDLKTASAAFQSATGKVSKTNRYVDINRQKSTFDKNTLSAAAASISKKPSRRVRLEEPNPTMFVKPPLLKPTHQERLIEQQLQKEVARTPMTHEQYSSRKQDLLQAAMQAYDREVPTYEVMPDIRDEAIAAEQQSNAASRQNVMDLLYSALTNQSQTLTVKSPSTSLHLKRSQVTPSGKISKTRALDQFKGPVVSTILRELQDATVPGATVSTQQSAPAKATHLRHIPISKESKEKLRGLRTLENYELSKLRNRNSISPKPILTLLKAKPAQHPPPTSKYSDVGPQKRTDLATSPLGAGSFTALGTLQTRNEKYNQGKRIHPVRASIRKPARKPDPVSNNLMNRRAAYRLR